MEAERDRGVDCEPMMVAERATTPESAAPCSEQNNQSDDSTSCIACGALVDVFRLGDDRWICSTDIGAVVALAVDIYPTDISYSKAFEQAVLM